MINIKHSLVITVLLTSLVVIACSFLGEDEKDLPSIYFIETPLAIPSPVLTPTPVSTPTPIPIIIPTPQVITADDLIYEVKRTMSSVYSYQYDLEADVFMDAGGIVLPVNMIGNGIIEEYAANNYFSTGLLGVITERYYLQDSYNQNPTYIVVKDKVSGAWEPSDGTPIGILPVDFWKDTGIKLLDLEFDYSEKSYSVDNNIITLISDDSKASSLLELLGAYNFEDIILTNLNLEIDIRKNSLYVDAIRAGFVISNGGEFISEVLGLPALSEIGAAEVLIDIKFSDIDQARVIDRIVYTE
tara:strand:- start:4430 stop:5329 length:900 start_codon:yes stop_codon:yes gene_type:complete